MRSFVTLKPIQQRSHQKGISIEDVTLEEIFKYAQTPLYATSLSAVKKRMHVYQQSLKEHFSHSEIFYACKANFSFPILKALQEQGACLDIVSIGEWHAGRKAGFLPENICFAGVGKKESEWKTAIENGIGTINIEHLDELYCILNFISKQKNMLKRDPLLSLRLNPCLEIETHPHLKTGALDSKFGILYEDFQQWIVQQKNMFSTDEFSRWIAPLKGIHVHIGSQLMAKDIFVYTVKSVLDCAQFMVEQGLEVTHLDLGGGLGVPYEGVPENDEDIVRHVNLLCETLKTQAISYTKLMKIWGDKFENLFVCLEPGRSIVASSTVFLTTVLYTKINKNKENTVTFCYVDGAMNDFPRPSLYGARHHVEIVNFHKETPKETPELKLWNVVGPVCESGDFLAKDVPLYSPTRDDTLAFFEAGAYCRSMASQYNLRDLPSEVFIQAKKIIDVSGKILNG